MISGYVLDEVPEETRGAVNHPSSLGLLGLGPGHGQSVIHVTLLMQNHLKTQINVQHRPHVVTRERVLNLLCFYFERYSLWIVMFNLYNKRNNKYCSACVSVHM